MAKRKFAIPSLKDMEEGTPRPKVSNHFESHLAKKNNPDSQDLSTSLYSTPNRPAGAGLQQNVPPQRSSRQPSSVTNSSTVPAAATAVKTASSNIDSAAKSNSTTNKSNDSSSGQVTGSHAKPFKKNCLVVNPRQRGNPVLKHVRNVPWEYSSIVPDYEMGDTTCALFLSVRYHNLHPEYIVERLGAVGQKYSLTVLLVLVDVKDPHHVIQELSQMAIRAQCTLILAWSAEEAGRYLETYRAYHNKPADLIMEKVETSYTAQATEFLTTVKSVNRTDAATLLSTFGTLASVIKASREELELCPGLGPQKALRLYKAFREPFVRQKSEGASTCLKSYSPAKHILKSNLEKVSKDTVTEEQDPVPGPSTDS